MSPDLGKHIKDHLEVLTWPYRQYTLFYLQKEKECFIGEKNRITCHLSEHTDQVFEKFTSPNDEIVIDSGIHRSYTDTIMATNSISKESS